MEISRSIRHKEAALIVTSLVLAMASLASAAPQGRWLDCSSYLSVDGSTISVDRISYVFFAPGSTKLDRTAKSVLDSYISHFDAPARCHVAVDGGSDFAEGTLIGVALSERRARAVAAYLRKNGLTAPVRLDAYGSAHALVENTGGRPEAQNRYVELYVPD